MTSWRISPAGVDDVLKAVGSAAAVLSEAVDGLPAHAEAAVAGTDNCPMIADALVGFFEHHSPSLTSMGNRIANSVGGAASATSWYLTGDEQMAAAQQAGAAEIAGTGTWVPELPEGMG